MKKNNEYFFISNKVKILGVIIIIAQVIITFVNTNVSWRIVGFIITMLLIFIEIDFFHARLIVYEDKIIIKSFLENTCLFWREIKKIELSKKLNGKLEYIYVIGIEKTITITSFYHNHKYLVKLVVNHCKHNKLTYIKEDVLKFIE